MTIFTISTKYDGNKTSYVGNAEGI